MNRIILIGNGFDLAHKLPTSFAEFLDHYWFRIIEEILDTDGNDPFENSDLKISRSPSHWDLGKNYYDLKEGIKRSGATLAFKNKLLKRISEYSYQNRWVDIENEYYYLLKESFQKEDKDYSIDSLNQDFHRIRESLIDYITDIEYNSDLSNATCRNQIFYNIYSRFEFKDFTEKAINERAQMELDSIKEISKRAQTDKVVNDDLTNVQRNLMNRLGTEDDYSVIRKLLISGSAPNYFDVYPDNILFLNFNYTKSEKHYYNPNASHFIDMDKKVRTDSIHIHGSVYTHDRNPVIFGFGDEIDENYKAIENLNDNRYLEHIKSIKYLETDNYKRLLEFINGDQYQIFIFGHSCGNSDRTLLNTLFEHENCVSIKPFYYKKSDLKDNFSELIMNITRNFNDKALLRDKVVNKLYCEELCKNA